MDGLTLGLIGGVILCAVSALGALSVLFNNHLILENEESIERKLEFSLGCLFLLTALSLNHFSIDQFWILLALFIAGGVSVQSVEKLIKKSVGINCINELRVSLFLIMVLIKNIPEGMSAGAIMNFSHTGLSYSLITAMAIHHLFEGAVIALSFLTLGLDPALAFIGVIFLSSLELTSTVVGGFLSRDLQFFIPYLMIFVAGLLTNVITLEIFEKIKIQWKEAV